MTTSTQRVALVTGGSSGIGAAAVHRLAASGWQVVATGRSAAKLAAVAASVRSATGAEIHTIPADFAVLDDVQRLASEVAANHPRLDLLANNAGLLSDGRHRTVDGHELTMQVNHLAPYLLTRLLWDRLDDRSRVINTSSEAHRLGRIDADDLAGTYPPLTGRWAAYCASKLANVLFTTELARLRPDLLTVSFHPGVIRSELFRPRRLRTVQRLPIWSTPETAAERLTYLVETAGVMGRSGSYFAGSRPRRLAGPAASERLAAAVWAASAALVGL